MTEEEQVLREFKSKNNGIGEIAQRLSLPFATVSRIIDDSFYDPIDYEYLEFPSKMNVSEFCVECGYFFR